MLISPAEKMRRRRRVGLLSSLSPFLLVVELGLLEMPINSERGDRENQPGWNSRNAHWQFDFLIMKFSASSDAKFDPNNCHIFSSRRRSEIFDNVM